jgi:two-component system, cell cycle response regulator DivK
MTGMPGKVLVIEDDARNLMLVRDILHYNGYTVLEASNGQEGINLAREQMPDLILMDVQMPNVDGITAGRILKSDPATNKIKLVALTSFAMKGDREKIIEAGFDDYIAKPINTRELPLLLVKYLWNPENTDCDADERITE